ncbi:uncharacterized protein [Dermacentor andersoni]|uniref:uncharacterized protein n=1 Tax=Dermacentor andersoni TaxID=34620 RepID=UPI003B3A9F98
MVWMTQSLATLNVGGVEWLNASRASQEQDEHVGDRNFSVLEVRAVTRYLNEAKRLRERNEASGKAKDYYGALFDAFNAKGSPSVDYDAFRQIEQEGLAAFAPALEPANSSDELNYTTPLQTGLESLARATPDISEQRWETQLREQKILASESNATLAVSSRAATVLGALSSLVKRRGEMDAELFVGWLVLQEVAPLVSKDLAEAIDVAGNVVAGNVVAGHQQRCLALAEMLLGWAVLAPFTDSAASLTIRLSIEARSLRTALPSSPCTDRRALKTFSNLAAFIEQALHDAISRSKWLRNMDVGELPSASTGSFLEKMAEFPRLPDLDPAYSWIADMVEHLTDNWNRSVRSRRAEPVSLWRRIETRFCEPGDIKARLLMSCYTLLAQSYRIKCY